jgi:hypothetical protein
VLCGVPYWFRLVRDRYWDDVPQPVIATDSDLPTIVYSVPGRVAVVAVVSYASRDRTATIRMDGDALGLGRVTGVVDVETGETLTVRRGRAEFPLKKHDIRVLRLTNQE